MLLRLEDVARGHWCTGCGTCAGVCGRQAVELVETPDGRLEPRRDPHTCNDCGLCHSVCPQIHDAQGVCAEDQGRLADPRCWYAQAEEEGIRRSGQSGGTVTALLAHALRSGTAERVLVVSQTPSRPLRPRGTLLTDPGALTRSQGSRYCPVPLNEALREVRSTPGRTIAVGVGCQLQGLSLARARLPVLRERIVLRVGLFCAGVLRFEAQAFLLRCAGVRPGQVASLAYRSKAWRGWPGDVRVVDTRGGHADVPAEMRMACKPAFTPLYCRACPDKANRCADLVCGDAYGACEDAEGLGAVIAWTKTGERFYEAAARAGTLISRQGDLKQIRGAQALELSCRRARAVASVWRSANREVSAAVQPLPAADLPGRCRRRSLLWGLRALIRLESPVGCRLTRLCPPALVKGLLWLARKAAAFRSIRNPD
jgi:coenzyme F420 hydrogenase subunit beta